MTHRKFTFGKFKGEDILDVCYANPSYITWLLNNTDFKLNDDEMEVYEEYKKKRRHSYHPGGEAACDPWEMWAWQLN